MKFTDNEYLKHENCTDMFIRIQSTVFDEDGKAAIVWACFMVQGLHNYWYATGGTRIVIKQENYDKWHPYTPKHTLRLE